MNRISVLYHTPTTTPIKATTTDEMLIAISAVTGSSISLSPGSWRIEIDELLSDISPGLLGYAAYVAGSTVLPTLGAGVIVVGSGITDVDELLSVASLGLFSSGPDIPPELER